MPVRFQWIFSPILLLLLIGQAARLKTLHRHRFRRTRLPIPIAPKLAWCWGRRRQRAAHVGVLKVLEELKIPIDIVVGTSAGSAVEPCMQWASLPGDIEATF